MLANRSDMCLTPCMYPNRFYMFTNMSNRCTLYMYLNKSDGCLTMFCIYPNRSDMYLTLCMYPNRSDGCLNLCMHPNSSIGCLTLLSIYPNWSVGCLTMFCTYPNTQQVGHVPHPLHEPQQV